MTKEDIYKAVYELMSDAYECDGSNSPDRTLGEIMGIMSLARELESEVSIKAPDHDGCMNCRHINKDRFELPCKVCKQCYVDKWEGAF